MAHTRIPLSFLHAEFFILMKFERLKRFHKIFVNFFYEASANLNKIAQSSPLVHSHFNSFQHQFPEFHEINGLSTPNITRKTFKA